MKKKLSTIQNKSTNLKNSKEIKLTLSEYIIGRYIQKHALSMRSLFNVIKK